LIKSNYLKKICIIFSCLWGSYIFANQPLNEQKSLIYKNFLGEKVIISLNAESNKYLISRKHIRNIGDNCQDKLKFILCFDTNLLTVAIPKKLKYMKSWTESGVDYTVEERFDKLSILGKDYRNVFVILVKKERRFIGAKMTLQEYYLLFSPAIGMLGFQEPQAGKHSIFYFFSGKI